MQRRVLKSMALTAFAVLVAIPAFAQVRADLGPLHIRIATDAPPPVRHEVRTARPDHTAVWTNGYWDRQGEQWSWSSGRWQQPTGHKARWVSARYQRDGNAWRYDPAHWSNQQLVEGEDYQRWKNEHHRSSGHSGGDNH